MSGQVALSTTTRPDARLVDQKLRRAWRKQELFAHIQGLASLLIWLVVLVLLDLFIDWFFVVPGYGRIALLVINLVTIGVLAYRRWWRNLEPFDPVRVALRVEGKYPHLQNLLVSFVQLRGDRPGVKLASPKLLDALRRQAIDITAPLNFSNIVNLQEIR